MRHTPLKKSQVRFTEKCHKMAAREVYPILLNSPSRGIEINYDFGSADDLNMGIDVTIAARLVQNRLPLTFTIQERFRKYDKWKIDNYNDVTFTTWNNNSQTPSEWYKFKADFMVYGFANKDETSLLNWAVVCIPILQLRYMARQIIPTGQNTNDRDQDFIAFKNDDLYRLGCLVCYKNLRIKGKNASKFNSYPLAVDTLNLISSSLKEILNLGFAAHKNAPLRIDGAEAGIIINKIYDILYAIDNYRK